MDMHLTGMHLISVHLIGIRLIKYNESPTLTIDRIQPFYLVVCKYLQLLVVAGISHFGAKCELALPSEWAAAAASTEGPRDSLCQLRRATFVS